MPAGELEPGGPTALTTFTPSQRERLTAAVARARRSSGLDVALYLGPLASGRADARALLAGRPDPAQAVVVAVDPQARRIEIVTGERAAQQCDERTCGLTAAAMAAYFGAGDLPGGLRSGFDVIAEHARRVPVLHASEY